MQHECTSDLCLMFHDVTPMLSPGFETQDPLLGAPSHGADAATVNKWWNSLTPTQQSDYLISANYIGNMNGIPITSHDVANCQLLGSAYADLLNCKHGWMVSL
jgi:hypothetical protein